MLGNFLLIFINDHIQPKDGVGLYENSVKFSFKKHSQYTRKYYLLCAVPESIRTHLFGTNKSGVGITLYRQNTKGGEVTLSACCFVEATGAIVHNKGIFTID